MNHYQLLITLMLINIILICLIKLLLFRNDWLRDSLQYRLLNDLEFNYDSLPSYWVMLFSVWVRDVRKFQRVK